MLLQEASFFFFFSKQDLHIIQLKNLILSGSKCIINTFGKFKVKYSNLTKLRHYEKSQNLDIGFYFQPSLAVR